MKLYKYTGTISEVSMRRIGHFVSSLKHSFDAVAPLVKNTALIIIFISLDSVRYSI